MFHHPFNPKIVYCVTREKKVYFSSVKFDVQAKQGEQSHEYNIAICFTSGENEQLPMSVKFAI